jgi:hypothetical protein
MNCQRSGPLFAETFRRFLIVFKFMSLRFYLTSVALVIVVPSPVGPVLTAQSPPGPDEAFSTLIDEVWDFERIR